jgi:hypothetical protein
LEVVVEKPARWLGVRAGGGHCARPVEEGWAWAMAAGGGSRIVKKRPFLSPRLEASSTAQG